MSYNLLLAFFLYSLFFVGVGTLALLYSLDCITAHTFFVSSIVYMCALALVVPFKAEAYTFKYKNGRVVEAATYREAANLCYKLETNGKYPGEEKGLEIIDVCANPVVSKGYKWTK